MTICYKNLNKKIQKRGEAMVKENRETHIIPLRLRSGDV